MPDQESWGVNIILTDQGMIRAKVMSAHCIPKQIPKNGTLFSLAYLDESIFPSPPRDPNPGNNNIPWTSENEDSADFLPLIFSV